MDKMFYIHFLEVQALFGSFCTKSAKIENLAANWSTFYSTPFELCSLKIGTLATLIAGI
jgi:hypothetical protein